MWLFDLFFLSSANMIRQGTDISKFFRESYWLRDKESRLYVGYCNSVSVSCYCCFQNCFWCFCQWRAISRLPKSRTYASTDTLLPIFPSFRPTGMVGEACLLSNAYYPRTPDYNLCSGVHVCWSEHSDSSFVYGFKSLHYGFGTMTATTCYPSLLLSVPLGRLCFVIVVVLDNWQLICTDEPAHDETYNKTCVTNKDSDQPVHPPGMARVLVYPSLDRLEIIEGTYGCAGWSESSLVAKVLLKILSCAGSFLKIPTVSG